VNKSGETLETASHTDSFQVQVDKTNGETEINMGATGSVTISESD